MRRLRVIGNRFPIKIAVVSSEFEYGVIVFADAVLTFFQHFFPFGYRTAEGGQVVHLCAGVLFKQARGRFLRINVAAACVVQHNTLGD